MRAASLTVCDCTIAFAQIVTNFPMESRGISMPMSLSNSSKCADMSQVVSVTFSDHSAKVTDLNCAAKSFGLSFLPVSAFTRLKKAAKSTTVTMLTTGLIHNPNRHLLEAGCAPRGMLWHSPPSGIQKMAIVIKTYSQRKNNNFSYKAGQCNNDWAQNNQNHTFMK